MKNQAAGKHLATLRDETKKLQAVLAGKLAEWKEGRKKRDALIDEAGRADRQGKSDGNSSLSDDDWAQFKARREEQRASAQHMAIQQQQAANVVAAYPEQPFTLEQQLTIAGRRTVMRYRLEVTLLRARQLVNKAMFVDQVGLHLHGCIRFDFYHSPVRTRMHGQSCSLVRLKVILT